MRAADAPVHPNLLPRIVPFIGLRVREDTAYTDPTGVERNAIRKRAEGDLRQAAEILTRLLQPNEVVLYIARGAFMPGTFEQLVSLAAHLLFLLQPVSFSGIMLVFTNSRLIALRTRKKLRGWNWDHGVFKAEWTGVARASKRGWLLPYIELVNQDGTKEKFWHLRRRDAENIKLLMKTFGPTGPVIPASPAAGACCSLCPKCFAALTPGVYHCLGCGTIFKNEKNLLIRALLIPGGAYFYSGRNMLGVFSGLIETLVLMEIGLELLAVMRVPLGVAAWAPGAIPQELLMDAIKLSPTLVFLKAVGIYLAQPLVRKFILA